MVQCERVFSETLDPSMLLRKTLKLVLWSKSLCLFVNFKFYVPMRKQSFELSKNNLFLAKILVLTFMQQNRFMVSENKCLHFSSLAEHIVCNFYSTLKASRVGPALKFAPNHPNAVVGKGLCENARQRKMSEMSMSLVSGGGNHA